MATLRGAQSGDVCADPNSRAAHLHLYRAQISLDRRRRGSLPRILNNHRHEA